MNDIQEIIKECVAGNNHAQEKLYNIFSPKMYALCLRYAKNSAEAEDSLQDGFIKIFTHIHTYKNKGSFEGWMKRIMINTSLGRIKKDSRMHIVEDINDCDYRTAKNIAIEALSANELLKIVQELPPQYKAVFNMYAIDNMNHKEISKALNISESTSKSNLSRARGILKAKIEMIRKREDEILNFRQNG